MTLNKDLQDTLIQCLNQKNEIELSNIIEHSKIIYEKQREYSGEISGQRKMKIIIKTPLNFKIILNNNLKLVTNLCLEIYENDNKYKATEVVISILATKVSSVENDEIEKEIIKSSVYEGCVSDINVEMGEEDNKKKVANTDISLITKKDDSLIESCKVYSDKELMELMINFITDNSGGKKPLTLIKIRRGLPRRIDRNKIQFMLNTLVNSKIIRKVKGNRYKGLDGKMITPDFTYELIKIYNKPLIVKEIKENNEMIERSQVFIVHGHDEAMKTNVQLLLERAEIEGVVLHEQKDKGRTIIEKLIDESEHAGYAVVLISPDDILEGGDKRARQNVILELGYFIGSLGKDKVRLLIKGDVEVPSDLQGILYEKFESTGTWKINLLKEISDTGIKVNFEKVISKL